MGECGRGRGSSGGMVGRVVKGGGIGSAHRARSKAESTIRYMLIRIIRVVRIIGVSRVIERFMLSVMCDLGQIRPLMRLKTYTYIYIHISVCWVYLVRFSGANFGRLI